jgi:hypothetical protein
MAVLELISVYGWPVDQRGRQLDKGGDSQCEEIHNKSVRKGVGIQETFNMVT